MCPVAPRHTTRRAAGYLAARTSRIKLGTAVVTLPLYEPVRVVENMAFVDILSGGRVVLGSSATAGYLGNVSEKNRADSLHYDDLAATTLLHGSPATVVARLRELSHKTGLTSLLLHYPPYFGHERAMKSLRLFAQRVMPEFRPPACKTAVA